MDESIIYPDSPVIEKESSINPVIKESDTVLRKREANKLAARRHRERRANVLEHLTDEKATLKQSIARLKIENTRLDTDLEILKLKLSLMYVPATSYNSNKAGEPKQLGQIQLPSSY